jgi:hypothetical protein
MNTQRQVPGFNPFASITIEDLKENRNEVIEIIKEHTNDVAMVMNYMVSKIEEAGNDVEEYTNTCLEELGLFKLKNTTITRNGVTYNHFSDYQDAVNREIYYKR